MHSYLNLIAQWANTGIFIFQYVNWLLDFVCQVNSWQLQFVWKKCMVIIIAEIYIAILKDENKNLKKAALDFAKLICIKDNLPTLSSRKRDINQLKPLFSTVSNESCSRTTSPQQNTKRQWQNYNAKQSKLFAFVQMSLSKRLLYPKAFWWLIILCECIKKHIKNNPKYYTSGLFNYPFFLLIFETFLLYLCFLWSN